MKYHSGFVQGRQLPLYLQNIVLALGIDRRADQLFFYYTAFTQIH